MQQEAEHQILKGSREGCAAVDKGMFSRSLMDPGSTKIFVLVHGKFFRGVLIVFYYCFHI